MGGLGTPLHQRLFEVALRLDGWLDTMRGEHGTRRGYTGPVVHWWQNSLQYTGVAFDWRYEGIIGGYLALAQTDDNAAWLEKARRAGDDVLSGQLASGNYFNSAFELNPYPAGTPHEAAADHGLLMLAAALKTAGDPAWETYSSAARRNIESFYIGYLWDDDAQAFRDQLDRSKSFVPNKSSTLSEALFLLARLTGDERYAERYALPTVDTVMRYQVANGKLAGAIWQNVINGQLVQKIFPYYVARCVPALLTAYEYARVSGKPGCERYLEAALAAGQYVASVRRADGSLPQVVYADGTQNVYPQWVSPLGDCLRAWALLEAYGLHIDPTPTIEWLLSGLMSTGGIISGRGFGSQISQREPAVVRDFRDLIACVGWVDKAFRYLGEASARLPAETRSAIHPPPSEPVERECRVRGKRMIFHEDDKTITITHRGVTRYRWEKGTMWASICEPEFFWK